MGRLKTIVTKRRCLTQTKTFSVAVEILPVRCLADAVPLANCSRDVVKVRVKGYGLRLAVR